MVLAALYIIGWKWKVRKFYQYCNEWIYYIIVMHWMSWTFNGLDKFESIKWKKIDIKITFYSIYIKFKNWQSITLFCTVAELSDKSLGKQENYYSKSQNSLTSMG